MADKYPGCLICGTLTLSDYCIECWNKIRPINHTDLIDMVERKLDHQYIFGQPEFNKCKKDQ